MAESDSTGGAGGASAWKGRIVVGVDGSDSSLAALRRGAQLAETFGSELVGVTTWEYPPGFGNLLAAAWSPESDAREISEEATRTVFADAVPAWYSTVIRLGSAARQLIEESENDALLIVGNRGRGGFEKLLLGSVSSTCAEHAKCSVLIVRE